MRAIDLATGKALPLIGMDGSTLVGQDGGSLVAAGAGNLVAAGAGNYALAQAGGTDTDTQGRFDFTVPQLKPGQIVKIVAEQGELSLVSLVDHAGRSLAAEDAPAAFALAQVTGEVTLTVRLRLTAATSGAAKAFEGAFKLRFQLPEAVQGASLAEAMEAAQEAVAAIATGLAADPGLATKLVTALDANGELEDVPAYQAVLDSLGATAGLAEQVRDLLRSYVAATGEDPEGDLDPVTSEDFPVGDVEITTEGAFTFEDADGERVTGTIADGKFVPTQDQVEPTDPGEDPGTPGGSGGSGGGGSKPPPFGDAEGGLDIRDGNVNNPSDPEGLEP